MVINGLTNTAPVSSVSGVSSNSGGSSSPVSAAQPAATADISPAGSFFGNLEKLKEQDPAKLKQVLSDISTQLQTAAQSASGSQQQFLTQLADKFQSASQSGDISALQAHKDHGHGGHHHHHAETEGAGAYSASTPTAADAINGAQSTTGTQPAAATASGSAAQTSFKALFDKISSEVSSALVA